MKTPVWILLCLLFWLGACSTERIVEKPVPVDVVRVERVAVPADLLTPIPKQPKPEGEITYGQGIELWSEDRSTIDKLNGRLKAIATLDHD